MKSVLKKLALTLVLFVAGLPAAQAAAPAGKLVSAAIALQGGSDSEAIWAAPYSGNYKVHVWVPKNGTATNVLYRVYPKGKKAGSTDCLRSDLANPCYEITLDQSQHQNSWVQLVVNDNPATRWEFIKNKGFVAALASNLSADKTLKLTSVVRFGDTGMAVGESYQGGIIFYLDGTGEHGLVAAPSDQSAAIQWCSDADVAVATGANSKAIGAGLMNTNRIVKALGAGGYAAKLTADLVLDGYHDWYLPSQEELILMNKTIGQAAPAPLTNVGGFDTAYYWSSTDYGLNGVWFVGFGLNWEPGHNKTSTFHVRAIRAF